MEEQFYIIVPLALIIIWKLKFRLVILILALAFFISLWLAHWGAYNKPSAAFYLLPTRGWELLIGVLTAFHVTKNGHPKSKVLCEYLSLLGLGMIA